MPTKSLETNKILGSETINGELATLQGDRSNDWNGRCVKLLCRGGRCPYYAQVRIIALGGMALSVGSLAIGAIWLDSMSFAAKVAVSAAGVSALLSCGTVYLVTECAYSKIARAPHEDTP